MTRTTRDTRPFGNFAWTQHTPCLGCIRKFEHKCACKAFYHYDPATRKSIQLRYPPAHFPTTSILDLPAELRNQIYELAFVKPDTLHHDWWQPCLTFATRQIREESLPLFYASTHFCIRIRPGRDGELADIKQAKRWALSLDDKHVRNMRKVSIHGNIPLDYFPHLDLVYDLDIGADGKVACTSNAGPTSDVWHNLQRYSVPLARAIEALMKDLDGRQWSRRTLLSALRISRKARSKAVMLDRQLRPDRYRK